MTTSRHLRRSGALLAGLGVVAALALVPAGSANAKIAGGTGAVAQSDAEFIGSGGGDCDLITPAGSDDVESKMKPITKSGTVHRSVAINAQYANSLDSTDKVRVKGSYRSTTVVKKHKKDLASVSLTGKGKLTTTHTLQSGSHCSATGEGYGIAEVLFTEHKAGHLVLTRSTVKSAIAVAAVVNMKTKQELAFSIFQGNQSHEVSKLALKPGRYELVAEYGVSVGASLGLLKAPSPTRTAKVDSGVNFTFTPKK